MVERGAKGGRTVKRSRASDQVLGDHCRVGGKGCGCVCHEGMAGDRGDLQEDCAWGEGLTKVAPGRGRRAASLLPTAADTQRRPLSWTGPGRAADQIGS